MRVTDGTITSFQFGRSSETQTWRINKHGAIAGLYFVGFRAVHAFLRTP